MDEGLHSNLRREWRGLLIVTMVLLLACQTAVMSGCEATKALGSAHEVAPVAFVAHAVATPARPCKDGQGLGDHPDLTLAGMAAPFPHPTPEAQRPEVQQERFEQAAASVRGGATLESIDCIEYPCLTYAEIAGRDLAERSTALFDGLNLGCERCNRQVSTYYDHDEQTALVVTAVYPRTNDDLTSRWIDTRLSARIDAYRGARTTESNR